MNEHRFRAMGCQIVLGGAAVSCRPEIERLFANREAVFSRFVPGSELNRVNTQAGRPVIVSPIFARTLRVALEVGSETAGIVTPSLGAPLEAAGYTSDSSALEPDPRAPDEAPHGREIALLGRVVLTAPDVKLDLNGVVKALAVDDSMTLFPGAGFVSAGGDVATRGTLSVALPAGGAVSLVHGALATSGRTKRWWLRGGDVQHHLIDPRSGLPSVSPWSEVTACGANCLSADANAKLGFLLGEDGPSRLDDKQVPARFVRIDGEVVSNATWLASMDGALACT
jgi:thiamine biosynthesis lipoprotein